MGRNIKTIVKICRQWRTYPLSKSAIMAPFGQKIFFLHSKKLENLVWSPLCVRVLVWIAETRIAEMIEIEEKPELPKRVYCTRPDLPKWTN